MQKKEEGVGGKGKGGAWGVLGKQQPNQLEGRIHDIEELPVLHPGNKTVVNTVSMLQPHQTQILFRTERHSIHQAYPSSPN